MSFDLFVGSFFGGERAPFPSAVLKDAFGPYISSTQPKWYMLRFGLNDPDTCALYADTGAEEIDKFSINPPLEDSRLYEALLSVLRVPGLALYMPGQCPPLIGNPETIEHLPASMIAALGEPVMLKAAAEIPQRIRES